MIDLIIKILVLTTESSTVTGLDSQYTEIPGTP